MHVQTIVCSVLDTNSYLLSGDGRSAVLVDPGVGARLAVSGALAVGGLQLNAIAITHGHTDHLWDAGAIANEHDVPVYIHEADAQHLEQGLNPATLPWQTLFGLPSGSYEPPRRCETVTGGLVNTAGIDIEWIWAPGHTPGSCLLRLPWSAQGTDQLPAMATSLGSGPMVLSGDVLFAGSIGRTDFPGGNYTQMTQSLQRLQRIIAPSSTILPGHGPATTMARELEVNQFLAAVPPMAN